MKTNPTSIRLSREQLLFLKRLARVQKHGKVATSIRRLIDREMGVAS